MAVALFKYLTFSTFSFFIFLKAVVCPRSSSTIEDQSKIQFVQITGKVVLILKVS